MKHRIFNTLWPALAFFIFLMLSNRNNISFWMCFVAAIISILFGYAVTRTIERQLRRIAKKRVEEVKEMDFGEDVVYCGAMSCFKWKFLFADAGVAVLLKDRLLFIRYNLRSHETLFDISFSDISGVSSLSAKKRFSLFLKSGEEKRFLIDDDHLYYELKQLAC